MSQLNVTSTRALQVCWSLFWRFVLYSLLPIAILAAAAYRVDQQGILAGAGMAEAALPVVVLLAGLVLAFLGPVFIVRRVLGLAYSDFRIVLDSPTPRFKIEPQLRAIPRTSNQGKAPPKRKVANAGRSRIEPSFVN
jgi:peptidoglycan/LPS O-acetylase OafA/YrhL